MKFYLIVVFVLISPLLNSQDQIPFEDKLSYKFELDYNFKTKTTQQSNELEPGKIRTVGSSLLPYVKVFLTLTNMPADRYRVRIINDLGAKVLTKKIKHNMRIIVDMGYADDIKDGIGPHRYDIYFEDKSKNKLSKIVLDIDKEGNFLVNEQLYGKI